MNGPTGFHEGERSSPLAMALARSWHVWLPTPLPIPSNAIASRPSRERRAVTTDDEVKIMTQEAKKRANRPPVPVLTPFRRSTEEVPCRSSQKPT